MAHRVCPWWLGYLLMCPLRRLVSHPVRLLTPYVREGMTVLEPGPGMGFFTIPLASLVGKSGRVIAVDIQPKMLRALLRRAARAGVADRIETRLATADSMQLANLAGTVDFTLAFAVVHELPDARAFFAEAAAASKPGARMFFAEPAGHVKTAAFDAEMQAAAESGFTLVERPAIRRHHAALLKLG